MKRVFFLISIAFLAFISAGTDAGAVNRGFNERFAGAKQVGESGTYTFDRAHSSIGFRVKHMGLVDVPGYFRDFTGTINYDAKDVSKSSVQFSAKTTSVDTGVAPRDKHLRTADFFDVEKYPEMSFKSTNVEKKGKDWMVTGDLTMRGVTKSVSFPFELAGWLAGDDKSGPKMGITAKTTINRRDFGVNYGTNLPNGVAALSDNVVVDLQIEANGLKPAADAKPAG